MDLQADENIRRAVIDRLIAEGHSVVAVGREAPGIDDLEVLRGARTADRLLITSDLDFGDLVFRQHQSTNGVLLLRLHALDPEEQATRVAEVLRVHGEQLRGKFAVLTRSGVRIRDT